MMSAALLRRCSALSTTLTTTSTTRLSVFTASASRRTIFASNSAQDQLDDILSGDFMSKPKPAVPTVPVPVASASTKPTTTTTGNATTKYTRPNPLTPKVDVSLPPVHYVLHAQCSPNNAIFTLSHIPSLSSPFPPSSSSSSSSSSLYTTSPSTNPNPPQKIAGISSGIKGFKHSQRGSYEAGYQCSVWMFEKIVAIQARTKNPLHVEVRFKGRGDAREALRGALMTAEGDGVRDLIKVLTDCTPIRVGGTRAKKMQRR